VTCSARIGLGGPYSTWWWNDPREMKGSLHAQDPVGANFDEQDMVNRF